MVICGLFVAPETSAKSIEVQTAQVELNPEDPSQKRVGKLIFQGGFAITSSKKNFGGLSGLHIDRDGQRLLAVTDKGYWLTASLLYDARGNLSGIDEARMSKLRDTSGRAISGKKKADSEAIELVAGGLAVSFERNHRIWHYRPEGGAPKGRAEEIDLPAQVKDAPGNGGLEAITELADGRLLIVTEGWRDGDGRLRGWLRAGKGAEAGWSTVSYATTGDFVPTDFARLPSGDLLALERRYTPLTGPAARLQIVKAGDIQAKSVIKGREIAQIWLPLTVDNMEGVAVATRGDETFIYLVSDDNFSSFQRNLLLMFKLAE
jgi:hypothetical protein